MAQTFTLLKVSQRGAKLITDGNKVCWVMGRCMREDGTLTPSGMRDFENATKTYDEYKAEEAVYAVRRAMGQTDREIARQLAFEASKTPVVVKVRLDAFVNESERAYKFWGGGYTYMYGRQVKAYEYLPKSQVSLNKTDSCVEITLPMWLKGQKGWLERIKVA